MSIKQIGQQLNAYECIQLLDKIAEYRVANIKRDEKNSDNLTSTESRNLWPLHALCIFRY